MSDFLANHLKSALTRRVAEPEKEHSARTNLAEHRELCTTPVADILEGYPTEPGEKQKRRKRVKIGVSQPQVPSPTMDADV
jgi:hypothetical protein